MKTFAIAAIAFFVTAPVSAQWLTRPTPGLPRLGNGKPNLTAPAPRTNDGRPDLSGYWYPAGGGMRYPDPAIVLPWAVEVARERQDTFLRDRPSYRCLPSGPETVVAFSGRIVQTPTLIAILNDDLTHRQIFTDGRELESDPSPTWMGYSVGRWEGDTLVVESFGFNDKTWLNMLGLPHTEDLRVLERFRRLDLGHLQIEVTFTDPGAYTKPWGGTVNLQLAADTEMIEAYCENSSDHWTGRWSDAQKSQVSVPADVLATYVGVYSGLWDGRPQTVRVELVNGQLTVAIAGIARAIPLVARSDTSFISAQGYEYDFIRDGAGPATHIVEHHVSGSYRYQRQP